MHTERVGRLVGGLWSSFVAERLKDRKVPFNMEPYSLHSSMPDWDSNSSPFFYLPPSSPLDKQTGNSPEKKSPKKCKTLYSLIKSEFVNGF